MSRMFISTLLDNINLELINPATSESSNPWGNKVKAVETISISSELKK